MIRESAPQRYERDESALVEVVLKSSCTQSYLYHAQQLSHVPSSRRPWTISGQGKRRRDVHRIEDHAASCCLTRSLMCGIDAAIPTGEGLARVCRYDHADTIGPVSAERVYSCPSRDIFGRGLLTI